MFIKKYIIIAREYSGTFWTLIGALFIDRVGGALIFPFLSLYLTQKFSIGMTEVGTLFLVVSFSSFFGSLLGGALTDKFGRRKLMIFGLIASATSTLALGFANDMRVIYIVALFVGLLSDVGHPATQAMVTDILPESKRLDGFGILRVVANLAVTIGPAIGGIIAAKSFLWLFIIDAIASSITAFIVFAVLPETKPKTTEAHQEATVFQTFKGYSVALKDGLFMAFLGVTAISTLVYMQMNSTLAVYLRDYHAIDTKHFGYILSLNAAMVVVFQFFITRKISRFQPMLLMTIGTLLYAIGFAAYGFAGTYGLFLLAMVIITIGEMIVSPTSSALVARLAPEEMRGRYMAVTGFSWIIPSAIGPLAAGLVMDNLNPNWVWYACGILGLLATGGYFILYKNTSLRLSKSESSG
jgi:MFS family permease